MLQKAKYEAQKVGWGGVEGDSLISKKEEFSKIVTEIFEKMFKLEK